MTESPEPAVDEAPPADGRGAHHPGSAKPKSSSLLARVIQVLMALALGAAAFQLWITYPRGSVDGDVRYEGAPEDRFVVVPVTCFSGDHWGFDGVWLVTETLTSGDRRGFRGGLKIVAGGDGEWAVFVEDPTRCRGFKCEQRPVPRQQCRVFDVTVERRHRWLRYRGHASFDCALPDGSTWNGQIAFDHCGWVPSGGD